MPEGCIFCGGGPLTREDVISTWFLVEFERRVRQTPLPPSVVGRHRRSRVETEDSEPVVLGEWDAPKPEVVAKLVCGACNNGWMSEIDNAAKPILLLLIDGMKAGLTRAERRLLARWFGMKSVVHLASETAEPFPRHWAQEFYRERDLPITWRVRIGVPADRVGVLLGGATFTYESRPPLSPFPIRLPGFTWSWAIGDLSAQVIGLRHFETLPMNRDLLVSVWPPEFSDRVPTEFIDSVPGEWPPNGRLTIQQIHRMGHNALEPRPTG